MNRLLTLLSALALAALAVAAPAHAARKPAPPLVGIGEQSQAIFSDPFYAALGVRDVRVVVGWDALRSSVERPEVDAYLNAARAANARVLLSFSRSRDNTRKEVVPSVRTFTRIFRQFRARYPWVRDYVTWNEANHCSQPTCKRPELVARYYDALRHACPRCSIAGADVLDTTNMASYVRRFARTTKTKHPIWGLHNYVDANRLQAKGTRALLRLTKGDVWFTETGGLVWRLNAPSRIHFPESVPHAAKAVKWVFRLAALSRRVKRMYFYNWRPGPTWDSGLLDAQGQPRPAYDVIKRWLSAHRRARS